MKISKTAESLPASGIRKFVPFAEKAKEKGLYVYHLNIGQPDLKTPIQVRKAINEYDFPENHIEGFHEGVIAYSKSEGMNSYREAIVDYYEKNEISINENEIVVTAGASEALIFAMKTVCDPGDKIIIPEPFYTNYNSFASLCNIKIVPFPTSIEDDFHLKNITKNMESLIDKKTKAILICNPGNPTGTVYTEDELMEIVDIAEKNDLFIISDEVYREFTYDGKKHTSIMNVPRTGKSAIMIDSASKRFSLCGSRIGRLVSKNIDVIHSVTKMAQARLSVPTISQIAGIAALKDLKIIDESKKKYVKRRDIAYRHLTKSGLKCSKPSGAFYMLVDLGKGIDAEEFVWFMLELFNKDGETVMVTPAKGFYKTAGKGESEIRLAFVLEKEKIKKATKILAEGLHEFKEWKKSNPENGYQLALQDLGILG